VCLCVCVCVCMYVYVHLQAGVCPCSHASRCVCMSVHVCSCFTYKPVCAKLCACTCEGRRMALGIFLSCSLLRMPNWPGRTTLLQDPSAHVYSALFLLSLYLPCLYLPEPWTSHSFILSVPIHAQQATPPHQARSFS
jgi:hypothetical protein